MFDKPSPCDPNELTPDDIVEALIAADAHEKRVREGAEYELFKREVRRTADALERKDDRKPVRRSLREQLQQPLNPLLYAIDQLLPMSGNALFAGQYKAGKTTFNGQLLKAWADAELGAKFLGEFACHPDPERPNVSIFNYEMSEDQFQRWLARVGIVNDDRVMITHLRGLTMPLSLPDVRDEMVSILQEDQSSLWIVDPASRAMAGFGDVNSNTDVANWLGWLDEIKARAGVRDLVLNIHMGHAAAQDHTAERAIGAQAWSAWADALWMLNKVVDKGGNETRWFRANGRDVEYAKKRVMYEARDMSVALVEADPERHAEIELRNAIIRVIQQNPGINTREIREQAVALHKARVTDYDQMAETLVREELVRVIPKGKAKCHYWHDQMPRPIGEQDPEDDG